MLLTDAGLSIPDYLRPTRLICQPHVSVEKLLPALQLSGFASSRGGSLHQISSTTVICVGEGELQSPFTDFCLWIPVAPTHQLLSGYDEQMEAAMIEQLQNKLLRYRLMNRARVQMSEFDAPDFSGPIRTLARTLGACIVDAPDLQSSLLSKLRGYDVAARIDQVRAIECIIIEALLACCHQRRSAAHVGEVTELANAILSREGEMFELKPRQVGAKLKTLGFRTMKLDSGGRGLYLLAENCRRIHELARSYGVPSSQPGLPVLPGALTWERMHVVHIVH